MKNLAFETRISVDQTLFHLTGLMLSSSIFIISAGLTRMFPPGLSELIKLDGISVLLHCMQSEVTKLGIKSIFLIMSYYSNTEDNIPEPLMKRMNTITNECISLLRSCSDPEVAGHLLSMLNAFITNHQAARQHCKHPDLRLKDLLREKLAELPADPIVSCIALHIMRLLIKTSPFRITMK